MSAVATTRRTGARIATAGGASFRFPVLDIVLFINAESSALQAARNMVEFLGFLDMPKSWQFTVVHFGSEYGWGRLISGTRPFVSFDEPPVIKGTTKDPQQAIDWIKDPPLDYGTGQQMTGLETMMQMVGDTPWRQGTRRVYWIEAGASFMTSDDFSGGNLSLGDVMPALADAKIKLLINDWMSVPVAGDPLGGTSLYGSSDNYYGKLVAATGGKLYSVFGGSTTEELSKPHPAEKTWARNIRNMLMYIDVAYTPRLEKIQTGPGDPKQFYRPTLKQLRDDPVRIFT